MASITRSYAYDYFAAFPRGPQVLQPSACPSVRSSCASDFIEIGKTSNLVKTYSAGQEYLGEQILGLKVKGQGHWERKCKNRLSRVSSLKVDRLTSNRDQNDHRPILHVSSNTFHQRKNACFVIFICNHPGGPHVAAAIWPCT